ncbi:septation protein IspZ [Bradyrhizobium sp. Leo170]|uniref:septation protein IspZ n=1 Tax=Bradyrhizobium sp. Leo170 TaxID=1571199 RepID=UPI00102EBB33|nr:septation protein IspZ [Bradyrhizobium sp. Leo170]TAI62684.1 intracellular septation protein [Bradyrhizobium sp. Leo170]
MGDFFRAAKFLLLDLASTIFFLVLYLLTQNMALSVVLGSALGVIQIVIQIIRQRPVHSMEWLSLFLVVAAGSATIVTDDPRFVLFKPSVIYVIVGIVMLKAGWMVRYLPAVAKAVSSDVAIVVGYSWAALMFMSAAVNALVAIACTVQTWAMIMPIFGLISKVAIFVGGFLAIRLTTIRRIRAMPADKREVLLAATGVPIEPWLPVKSA